MPAPKFHPLIRLIFCALGLIIAAIVMGFMLLAGSALATVWTGRPPAEQLADVAARYALPLTVLSYPAQILWVALCRTQFDRRSFVSLGLRARRLVPDLARGALTGALSIGLLWSVLWLTGTISVVGWSPEAFEIGAGRAIVALLGYAIAFFAVGFFEELLFRGYALHNFTNWLGWKGAVAAQAIIFALIHLGNVVGAPREAKMAAVGALPSLVLIAVFFALCYRKTGSLWFPIGFHFAWNFCLGCVFSLPVSGIETFRLLDVQTNNTPASWLSGGSFGAEGSFFLIPILAALIFYISKAPDHPQALLDLGLLQRAEAPIELSLAPLPLEEPEVAPESRFRTKFGTSQGFSADTLRELRDLQEAREREQAQAQEAARREQLVTSDFAPPVVVSENSFIPAEPQTPKVAPETVEATAAFAQPTTKNAEVTTKTAEVATEMAKTQTEIIEKPTKIAEMQTEITKKQTEVAEMKTEIGKVATKTAEVEAAPPPLSPPVAKKPPSPRW